MCALRRRLRRDGTLVLGVADRAKDRWIVGCVRHLHSAARGHWFSANYVDASPADVSAACTFFHHDSLPSAYVSLKSKDVNRVRPISPYASVPRCITMKLRRAAAILDALIRQDAGCGARCLRPGQLR